jgi:peptidoglycan/xylan/chitin deacetylase (PgdA/CDA1 family)
LTILLTFDVEDWFQVENFKGYIPFSTWDSFDLRVEKNTIKILDLLDSFVFKPKATFFILGWIAQKLPDLVRQIHARGHEVASHGFNHH